MSAAKGLGRREQFDERSRAFPIRTFAPVAEAAPRSYTWDCPAWLDQGAEGACVGFAWAHEAAARPALVPGVTNAFAREGVYHAAQRIDPWDGGAYPGAAPFYEGTSVLAGAKVMQGLGAFAEYRWAFGLDDLVRSVGLAGPVVLGVQWREGMWDTDANGFVWPKGPVVGGHAILAFSVNLRLQRFTLRNSWGRRWGLGGSCHVSFDSMATLLAGAGEACVPVRRRLFDVTAGAPAAPRGR